MPSSNLANLLKLPADERAELAMAAASAQRGEDLKGPHRAYLNNGGAARI